MKKLFYLFLGCMLFYFIKYPSRAFLASQNGILLWFNQILPTLLPFCILSYILLAAYGKNMSSDREFLRIGVWEWFVIACGLLFGFPIGSRLAADICERGCTTKERAQILAGFTNNMSPAFVAAFVCTGVLDRPDLILPMYLILYGPSLVIGCIRLSMADRVPLSHKNTASRFRLDMQIIDAGIMNSFLTLMKLCGYIVMFSITADMFVRIRLIPIRLRCLMVGMTEITNGISMLSMTAFSESEKLLLAVLFLSMGGLSGIAQTNAMLSPSGLRIKNYICEKTLYTSCSLLLCLLFIVFC
jgi:hypothetical protein